MLGASTKCKYFFFPHFLCKIRRPHPPPPPFIPCTALVQRVPGPSIRMLPRPRQYYQPPEGWVDFPHGCDVLHRGQPPNSATKFRKGVPLLFFQLALGVPDIPNTEGPCTLLRTCFVHSLVRDVIPWGLSRDNAGGHVPLVLPGPSDPVEACWYGWPHLLPWGEQITRSALSNCMDLSLGINWGKRS